jgi:hypothetical protein
LRERIVIAACLLMISILVAPCAAKQIEGLPRDQHPWGQFKIGSWKRVKTTAETLNEKGQVTAVSTTETSTKLVDVDEHGYTLMIEVVVEVAGKRFNAQPQVVWRGFNGEAEGQTVTVKKAGTGSLTINDRNIPCEIRQVTIENGEIKRISTVHYSDALAPYVLKRETTSLDAAGKPTQVQSQVELIAVDMPSKVLTEIKSTSHVRVMHQQGKASTLTLEVHAGDVPGGVVSHTSKETDENGRVIRRSTLELLDYGLGDGDDEQAQMVRKIFHRARTRRAVR